MRTNVGKGKVWRQYEEPIFPLLFQRGNAMTMSTFPLGNNNKHPSILIIFYNDICNCR